MSALVHPSARIDPSAQVHPTAVVGAESVIGAGSVLYPYAIVGAQTTLGAHCVVHSFAVIGAEPQDRRTAADQAGALRCGDSNVFREGVTVSRGTPHGGGLTQVGSRNLFMANSHAAHDVQLGDDCTLANGVSLAGHVHVGSRANLGGHAAVHQFARIGQLAFVAANAMVSLDVPPFCLAAGDRARLLGLNTTGLERAGFESPTVSALKAAFRAILRASNRAEAARSHLDHTAAEVRLLARFVLDSSRGVTGASARGAVRG